MRREKQREVIRLVKAGYDVEAACAKAKVRPAALEAAAQAFKTELREAYSEATAILRAKALELALSGKDAGLLARLLEQRDAAQATANGQRIDTIQRVIVNAKCPACGFRAAPGQEEEASDFEVARRLAFTLAKGARDAPTGSQPGNGASESSRRFARATAPESEPEPQPKPMRRLYSGRYVET